MYKRYVSHSKSFKAMATSDAIAVAAQAFSSCCALLAAVRSLAGGV